MYLAQTWIKRLALEPHPEGGFFRETYVSEERVSLETLPGSRAGSRPLVTAIYYLLSSGDKSYLHRLQSDELWHFYQGNTLRVHVIHPDRRYELITLGPRASQGEILQTVIPAHTWFGAELVNPDSFALVGCTVSPGFSFEDFELGQRTDLLKAYPEHQSVIAALTRPD